MQYKTDTGYNNWKNIAKIIISRYKKETTISNAQVRFSLAFTFFLEKDLEFMNVAFNIEIE